MHEEIQFFSNSRGQSSAFTAILKLAASSTVLLDITANKYIYRSCILTFTLSHGWSLALQEKNNNYDSNLSVHLVCNKTSHLHFISHLPTRFFFLCSFL